MHRALWKQGVRVSTAKRHPFKMTHGYRKFAMSHAEQGGMKSINVKVLMDHSIGVEDSYYRPQERDISEDYKNAIRSLTICEKRETIQVQSYQELQDMRTQLEQYKRTMESEYQYVRSL